MACFLDWDDRGRFNFAPDRSAIVTECKNGHIEQIALAQTRDDGISGYAVKLINIIPKSALDLAIIGYADLP